MTHQPSSEAVRIADIDHPALALSEALDYIDRLEGRLERQAQSLIKMANELHLIQHGESC